MKRKLNSFMIIKFDSKSLKRQKFNMKKSLQEARSEGTVIKLAENTFLEVVQKTLGKEINFNRVNEISRELRTLAKEKNSNTNREKITLLSEEQDCLVFIPEVILIEFADKRHYQNVIDGGLFINGTEYVRIMAGAGNIRRNSVFFISIDIFDSVMEILDCGRDKSVRLNPAKLSAYTGLYASAGYAVTSPRFVVIPDYAYKRMATVDWIDDGNNIDEKTSGIELNAFDGQGLVSPSFSSNWAHELGVDYLPSTFIFRAPFMKGQVVTFDFHKLWKQMEKDKITDIWGNDISIEKIDCVLSESQAKLWDSYNSMDDYLERMNDRDLGFRISRYSPKTLRSDTSANYMFLQVLELDDDDIESLSEYTINYFRDIKVSDSRKTALYLGASSFTPDFDGEAFENLDVITKGILKIPDLMGERYFSQRINLVLKKKQEQAKLGKLLFQGNYAPLVSDPYAQAEWALGVAPDGLLGEAEHHSSFWSERNIPKVAGARSPLTHNSEMREMVLKDGWATREWYEHLNTAFILPFTSLDTIYLADADFDGDLLFTTDHPIFMDKRVDGIPINYEHGKANKIVVTPESIFSGDMDGMGSKIGFITNLSSTLHAMKYDFEEGSPERVEIERRLKLLRMYQGENIDGAKNGGVRKIVPSYWGTYDRGVSHMDKSLVADRRPYFTRWLYPHYNKKYLNEIDSMDKYCWSYFGMSFASVLALEDKTPEMKEAIEKHNRYSFFLFSNSPMNKLCWFVEDALDKINDIAKEKRKDYDYAKLYSSASPSIDIYKLKKMRELMEKYLSLKKAQRNSSPDFKRDIWNILDEVGRDARKNITSNDMELGDLCVSLIIETSRADSFAWTVFGNQIIENILSRHGRSIDVLVQDYFGEEEFLFSNYSNKEVMV